MSCRKVNRLIPGPIMYQSVPGQDTKPNIGCIGPATQCQVWINGLGTSLINMWNTAIHCGNPYEGKKLKEVAINKSVDVHYLIHIHQSMHAFEFPACELLMSTHEPHGNNFSKEQLVRPFKIMCKMMQPIAYDSGSFGRNRRERIFRDHNNLFGP